MTNQRAQVLVKGGLLVTGKDISRQDILIDDGRVRELGEDLSQREAARVIDAAGKYVLPGAIDAHSHPVYSDKIDTYSLTAAYGGVTTVVAFVGNVRAWGLNGYTTDVIKSFIEDAEKLSYLDFGVHGTYTAADEDTLRKSVPELVRLGVISFKFFMSYGRRGMQLSDPAMIQVMDQAAKDGALAMVHAENGCCIDYLIDKYTAEGKTSGQYFLPSQPNILEAEAVNRVGIFAQVVGSPLYPVHLSTHESLPVVKRLREQGLPLFAETCPHYLTLTNDEVLAKGPLGKVGPPLRYQEDCDALWEALADGTIDVIGSDSSGYTRKQKASGGLAPGLNAEDPEVRGENIFEARYGLNTIEFMVPVVWSYGVNKGRITLPRLVQVLCENPAKIFGLYPQKGTLELGSDGDLVIWDPTKTHVVDRQHGNADFSSFEGFQLLGMPDLTIQRGSVIIENGQMVATQGQGHFLPGNPNSSAYSASGHKI